MRLVIQRVNKAAVKVDGNIVSEIGKGFLILFGAGRDDDGSEIDWLAKKTVDLRIFSDKNGKMNLSLKDVDGEILLVSQFTLLADCRRGKRPDFNRAAKPESAKKYYREFAAALEKHGIKPKTGIFGADMKVFLENDGPVTIILEKEKKKK
ncbi:MAG: D-tyrosyl-tRNA(Tyr) deacylase [Candidatus Cloacimonas sp. 4484_275]|nr:MAG: D-tyrosyl-tRNA(Tyr) deacylase [Candidatus Cloacimonas sp. 4484_275]